MTLQELAARHGHLRAHLQEYRARTGREPVLYPSLKLTEDVAGMDLLYPLDGPSFVHIQATPDGHEYFVVQPVLSADEEKLLEHAQRTIFEAASFQHKPLPPAELREEISQRLDVLVRYDVLMARHLKDAERVEAIRHRLLRDIAGAGFLEPFTQDPYLEDIQGVGTHPIHVIHKYFGMMPTNLRFPSLEKLDLFLRNLSEQIGRPVSDARPIVDATLIDGSRINIVYSEDVSRRGPSFSIRRAQKAPITVTQLIAWHTMSAEIAAYLWLCLENGMSIFVCGEAACGKSATLNALLSFVNLRFKLYSAEDTPEIRPPHPVWQRLLTRESGPEESRVRMFDLLKAALRSRPNYIIVGEIRGAEGAVAFQAMQTGHPTVATFHASDCSKMIQRLSAAPISIPLSFVDNLNVAVFQQAVQRNGRLLRRVMAVNEIEGYSEVDGGVVTRPAFVYDSSGDRFTFTGSNNSYVLERKIADLRGYRDRDQIYRELAERARVLRAMVREKIFHHDEVNRLVAAYAEGGIKALPFEV